MNHLQSPAVFRGRAVLLERTKAMKKVKALGEEFELVRIVGGTALIKNERGQFSIAAKAIEEIPEEKKPAKKKATKKATKRKAAKK
ncbi:hypothetical protein IKE71_04225 [Candidatus Saccharibacteria bacterium]|nr:hypothetical protein [Candidatus Saccharibacteria bacterium]